MKEINLHAVNTTYPLAAWLPFTYFLYVNGYLALHLEIFFIYGLLIIFAFALVGFRNCLKNSWRVFYDSFWFMVAFSFFPLKYFIAFNVIGILLLFTAYYLEVMSIVLLTFILSLCFSPQRQEIAPGANLHVQQTANMQANTSLPPVLHIILDEHASLSELSPVLAKDLQQAYLKRGFAIYVHAYSRYSNTTNSIPNLVNFTESKIHDSYLLHQGRNPEEGGVIYQNAYFSGLAQRGYQISVYQPAYLNYCKSNIFVQCHTYPAKFAQVLTTTPLAIDVKLSILLKRFITQSILVKQIMQVVNPWWYTRGVITRTTSLTSLTILNEINRSLIKNSMGQAYFVHLMLPHAPYVYDANCQLKRKPTQWALNIDALPPLNDAISFARRQKLYQEQIVCTHKRLLQLLDSLQLNAATQRTLIILHGDHGNRIVFHSPDIIEENNLTQIDLHGAYHTWFATKGLTQGGLYENSLPIHVIFRDLVQGWWNQDLPELPRGKYSYLVPDTPGKPLKKIEW